MSVKSCGEMCNDYNHNDFREILETREKIHNIKRRQSISLEQAPNNDLAIEGDLPGLIDALEYNSPINEYMIYMNAAHYNHLHIMKYMHEIRNSEWDSLICSCAALHGNMNIVKYMIFEGCNLHEEIASGAAKGGHLEILKWLETRQCPMNEWIYWYATESNSLDILKWFRERENPCKWSQDIFDIAVVKGNMEIIEYLYDKGCPWRTKTFADAASTGNMELLKWLREKGCPMDEMTCQAAVYTGNFEILKWAYENKCELSWVVAEKAAIKGDLDIFKWLMEKDCEVNVIVAEEAARNGNLNILKWMYEHDKEDYIKNIRIILAVYKNNNIEDEVIYPEILEWLRETKLYDEIINEYNKVCAQYAVEREDRTKFNINDLKNKTKDVDSDDEFNVIESDDDESNDEYDSNDDYDLIDTNDYNSDSNDSIDNIENISPCGKCEPCLKENIIDDSSSRYVKVVKILSIIKLDVYYLYNLIKNTLLYYLADENT